MDIKKIGYKNWKEYCRIIAQNRALPIIEKPVFCYNGELILRKKNGEIKSIRTNIKKRL